MKCLFKMSKDDLRYEAIKMRKVLAALADDAFDDLTAVKYLASAALIEEFSIERIDGLIKEYSYLPFYSAGADIPEELPFLEDEHEK